MRRNLSLSLFTLGLVAIALIAPWVHRALATTTFTPIDFAGAIETDALGINNLGQIVGERDESKRKAHGFLLDGGSFSAIDFPDAFTTSAIGINNLGQIVGMYGGKNGHAQEWAC